MEPLSCLTVACTVVQFVDFGARVLSKGREFYLSHSGALARYEELQKDARQVNALVQVYSDQAKGLPAGVMAGMSNIIDECNLTAALLVSLLKDLHVQEKSGARGRFLARFFSSGKQAMRTVVKESQIEELNQKMLKLRSDIQGYVLAMIQHQSSAMQKTLSELSTNSAQTGKNLTTQLDAIKHEITGVLKAPSSNAFNASELEKLVPLLPKLVEESRAVACRAAILSSLYFPGIKERYGQITKTDDSFQWIFRSSTPDQSTPRVYFLDWLRSRRANDHIFWIGGKPGSGKSTLMKFLYDNAHTKEVLQEWAHPKKLFIGAFYFWISGGPKMLQSQIGLLRSLLYEIFRQNPDIVQFACPDKFNQGLSPLPLGTIDWTLDELLNAFKTATTNAQSDARFCFFIDGSDECEGYPEAIVDLIRDQFPKSSDIKLCLASRKWNVFIDEYGDKECRRSIPRHLYLEELTWNDIRNFVQQEFETLERFRKREKEDPASCKKLIDDIVLKAEGVFLWVCLVVKSLKRGIKNRDSVQTLQKRLAQIPGELPEYFGNMLNNVEDIYHADAAKIYQIMLKARHPYLFMFSYLWERNPQFGMAMDIAPQLLQNTRKLKEDLCVQLNSRCTDLLDIVKISGYQPDIMGEYKVVFCHRTVRDYMRGQNAQKTLNEWLSSSNMDTSFEPNV